jgi:dTDP-4-dehydrorhamnose reductase
MTKILVTGKDGQLGAHLARMLPALGHVYATGRESLDLAHADAIRRTVREMRPNVIVNAAGYTAVDKVESDARHAQQVNAIAPGILAEEAKRIGALLVHYSSVYVFDGTKPGPYSENDAPHPINAYGRSKLAGERAVAAAAGDYLILRASWVYDVRGRNFLLTILELAAERDVLRVVDDQVGSPTWASAIAQTTACLLGDVARARDASGVYNLAAEGAVSRFDFARRVLELEPASNAGGSRPRLVRISTSEFPLPARRPLNSVLDNRKLTSTFDVRPATWEHQLRACVRELRAALASGSGLAAHEQKETDGFPP